MGAQLRSRSEVANRPGALARVWSGAQQNYLAATLSVLGGLLLWEFVSRVLVANALFLAAPSQIIHAIYSLSVS